MKQLFFAGSFALAAILSYGWVNSDSKISAKERDPSCQTFRDIQDTIPKKEKKRQKDSLNKSDTSWPRRDTSGQ